MFSQLYKINTDLGLPYVTIVFYVEKSSDGQSRSPIDVSEKAKHFNGRKPGAKCSAKNIFQ
jgi:hypothetical protein